MFSMLWYLMDCPSIFDVIPQITNLIRELYSMDISKLAVKTPKLTTVMYDKDFGVSFDLNFLSRPELQQLIGQNTKITFDPKSHSKEEKLDSEALSVAISNRCVKGWKGVNLKWLKTQIPLEPSTDDENAEIPFTQENLAFLMKNAYGLDSWILDNVREAANFNEKKEAELKN